MISLPSLNALVSVALPMTNLGSITEPSILLNRLRRSILKKNTDPIIHIERLDRLYDLR